MSAPAPIAQKTGKALVTVQADAAGLTLVLAGALTAVGLGDAWKRGVDAVARSRASRLVIDCARVSDIDSAGAAWVGELMSLGRARGTVELVQVPPKVARLLDLFAEAPPPPPARPVRRPGPVEALGLASGRLMAGAAEVVGFVGEIAVALARGVRRPGQLRWSTMLDQCVAVGANALPIVLLLGFLVGLIMAYQSAIPLQRFGADIYVANLVGLSMLRELGPLITAVILAGRSGAAFAAEIGTMKVNEELDALETMGIDKLGFLVVPRLLAAIAMTPLLAVFMNLAGLAGAAVVMRTFGYPFVAFVEQLAQFATYRDLTGGLVKAAVFGLLVAAIGCREGMATGDDAGAVGSSTTMAVVAGIIVIVVTDGLFAVAYYQLGL